MLTNKKSCLATGSTSNRGVKQSYQKHEMLSRQRHVAQHVARLVIDYLDYTARPGASARRRGSSRCSSSTSTTPRVRVPRRVARLVTRLVVDYFNYAARLGTSAPRAAHRAACRRLLRLRRASGCLGTSRGSSRGLSSTTSTTPRVRVPRHVARLVAQFVVNFDYVARPGASARHVARHAARRRLLRLSRASGCLGTSRDSSHCLSRRSSSTTSPRRRVRVPRHVAQHVARLVVDYFTYAARLGASARRAACRVAHHRLLRLRRASGVPWHVTRLVVWLIVDYFDYAARSGASARRASRRRLLLLRRASACLGTPRGMSCISSSTTSPTPRIRVPRHVARLVIDYFAYAARPGASARRVARHAARCRLLRLRRASGCLGTSCGSLSTSTTPRIRVPRHVAWLVTRLVVNYFD
jgi:hypothetical protein